jgi:hypothetical protein
MPGEQLFGRVVAGVDKFFSQLLCEPRDRRGHIGAIPDLLLEFCDSFGVTRSGYSYHAIQPTYSTTLAIRSIRSGVTNTTS